MTDAREPQGFIDSFVARADPIWTALSLAEWNLSTTGDPRYKDEHVRLRVEEHRLYEDPAGWERVRAFYAGRDGLAPDLRRQSEVLYRYFLSNQSTAEENERLARLEADVQDVYINHRGTVRGRPVADNEITDILKRSTDEAERREAWTASKEVGARVAADVRELARQRNGIARRLGFRDHYEFALVRQEIDEGDLLALFDRLAVLTGAPYRRVKGEIDARLAARLSVRPEALAPWHYADPFFQYVPPIFDTDLDAFFAGKDVEAVSVRAYDGMGLEIRDILARSDLYERPGKNQHAFCTRIGREGDTRVLCNLRPNARWMSTQMHELGHAVYNKGLPRSLPYLLRTPAHTNSTEAIAMLMGRLTRNPDWLARVAGVDGKVVDQASGELARELSAEMLVLVRWVLVMLHFERALYADPDRADLNGLWWDLVERYQMVPRPAGRDAADWAAKYHVAMAPVYYHNYALGELTASQLERWIAREAGGLVANPQAGRLLVDGYFAHGARYTWQALVEVATGEPLRPEHFVEQFVG